MAEANSGGEAEGNIKGSKCETGIGMRKHDVSYRFEFGSGSLTRSQRKFDLIVYETKCEIVPTVWYVQLKYELVPEKQDYNFRLVIKRKDPLDHHVSATLKWRFYDSSGVLVFPEKIRNGFRLVHNDELVGEMKNITRSKMALVANICMDITIEYCHSGKHMLSLKGCPKVPYDYKKMHLSKL